MAEAQPAQPSQAPAAAPAAPAPSEPKGLEKVYKDFNVEAEAASFHQPEPQAPQAAPQQPAQQPKKFDPFDPNFGAHLQEIEQRAARAESALTRLTGEHTAFQRQLHAQRVEADLKQAAGTIAEKAGIDQDVAEVLLESRARKDPRLLAIWNNRSKNPKALSAAIEALSGEAKEKFTVRQDPQLVENQRAVRASQQQMATTTVKTDNDKWASMTPQERAQERNRIMRHG